MTTETKEKAKQKKDTNESNKVKTLDEPQQKRIIDAIKKFRKAGYNQIKIPPCGEEVEVYNRKKKEYEIKKADGKSAEGTGKWADWQTKKQTERNFDLVEYFSHDRNGKKPWNIALIQGDVSGDDQYGRCAIDADGRGREIVEEALLALDDDELVDRIRATPQTQTQDGYHWLLAYRKRDYKEPLESVDIWKGKGKHEEIKLIANGMYLVEAPSIGENGPYVAIKDDFDKIAKLTREELDKFLNAIKQVVREEQPEKEPNWADEEKEEIPSNNTVVDDKLVTIGQKPYIDGSKHDLAFGYACFMRRYLKMDGKNIHDVIEALDPNDTKNWNTVEDVLKQPKHKIMNRLTFRNLIAKITGDERAANNVINELMSLTPPTTKVQYTDEEELGQKPAARLLDLAEQYTEICFKDQDGNYYALIHNQITDSYEIINLDNDEFDQLLSGLYRKDTNGNELARKDWKSQVVENLKQIVDEKAKVDERRFKKTLYNRSVWIGDTWYYDLGNVRGEIWKVSKDEITKVKQSPDLILFKKLPDDHEQVAPDFNLELDKDGGIGDYLENFLQTFNFETEGEEGNKDHILILKCYIAVLFLNAAAFPINHTTADEGGTKTTFERQIKSLVDPVENKNGARIEDKILTLTTALNLDPEKTWERFVTIHHNFFTCFDNVDEIPRDILDEMCMAVTGYCVEKRIHYEMDKMMKLVGRRPLALTSVSFTPTKPDFLDLVIHSKLLPAKIYKSEEQVWREFYELKPKLLGFIFKKIQEFLGKYNELKGMITPKTRLADFEIQCEVMNRCLGNEPEAFQKAWVKKKGRQVEESLENSSLYILLKRYLIKHRNQVIKDKNKKPEYIIKDCQSQDHYTQVMMDTTFNRNFISEEDKIGWCKNPAEFGKEMKRLNGQLGKVGIKVTSGGKVKNKWIKLINYTKWAEGKEEDFWKIDEIYW